MTLSDLLEKMTENGGQTIYRSYDGRCLLARDKTEIPIATIYEGQKAGRLAMAWDIALEVEYWAAI